MLNGQTPGSRSAIEERIRDEVQKIFAWRPSELSIVPSASGKKGTIYSPASGIFDKHFPEKFRLKRIVYRPDLLEVLETLAEDSFNESLPKLPEIDAQFKGEAYRSQEVDDIEEEMENENGVISHYLSTTGRFCVQLAAMVALHPKSSRWGSLVYWADSVGGTVAIADLILRLRKQGGMSPALVEAVDDDVREFIGDWQQKALSKVEVKGLTVGSLEVMEALGSIGPYIWTSCKCMVQPNILSQYDAQIYEKHNRYKEKSSHLEIGHDSTLPLFTYPEQAAQRTTRAMNQAMNTASSTSSTSQVQPEASLSQDKKRKQHTSAPTTHRSKRHKQSKPAEDSSIGSRRVVKKNGLKSVDDLDPKRPPTYRSILQQGYAQLVCHDLTFFIFHSGNYQRIAYRRRYPEETLYISQLIEPHVYPRYGKAHVGFDIASLKDTISRWKLNKLPRCTSDGDGGGGNGGHDCDESGPKGGGRGSGGGGGGGGGDGPQGNFEGREHGAALASGKSLKEGSVVPDSGITGEHMKTITLITNRRMMLVSLKYSVHDSPRPVPFLHMECPPHAETRELPYTIRDTFGVIMTSEIGAGATGIVLRGTLFVQGCGDITSLDIAMKISSGKDEKAALAHEYATYRRLNAHGITRGIGTVLGLFRDACEPGDYALVMLYNGIVLDQASICSLSPAKRVASMETLSTIHAAGFLHGDIRPENLLGGEQGLTLIDFAYATESNDQDAMRNEREQLSLIIGVGNIETAVDSGYPRRSRTPSAGSRSMTADSCDSYASHTSTNSSNTAGSCTLSSGPVQASHQDSPDTSLELGGAEGEGGRVRIDESQVAR